VPMANLTDTNLYLADLQGARLDEAVGIAR
jgi:uncharacterized protein YjbI with pentapeptide repeats